MLIEVGAPAALPLGLIRVEGKAGPETCLLGLTVQHPPVNLSAQADPAFKITGARADTGYRLATHFLNYHRLEHQALVEIERTAPACMGLGSEAMLGLSLARALTWVHTLPAASEDIRIQAEAVGIGPEHALALWGFARGGLLLLEAQPRRRGKVPAVLRRAEVAHKESEAWAFVFFFPRLPSDIPETLEIDRLRAYLESVPYLSVESGRLLDEELWPAVEHDDLSTFGRVLMKLQAFNQAALTAAGRSFPLSPDDRAVLDLMRDGGALAWGQSLTGLGLYGLVQGAKASIALRTKIRRRIGPFGGQTMATITDNTGARFVVKENEDLTRNKLKPPG